MHGTEPYTRGLVHQTPRWQAVLADIIPNACRTGFQWMMGGSETGGQPSELFLEWSRGALGQTLNDRARRDRRPLTQVVPQEPGCPQWHAEYRVS